MLSKRFHIVCLLLCMFTGALISCDAPSIPTYNNATPVVTSGTVPSGSATQLNTWLPAAPGVEVRYEHWKSPGPDEDTIIITRFDLHHVHLSVKYQPAQPLTMSEWMKQEQALAIINGGYFDQNNSATGLVISNGHVSGTSYDGFGGMLAVDSQGNVHLRSLREHPYDAENEQLQQATQSSPLLMLHGQRTQFNANASSQRRSVVAIDKQGRLLFIVSPEDSFTLDELADLLASSDLAIDTALNLDGGHSTGLYLNTNKQHIAIDSMANLPLVIVVR